MPPWCRDRAALARKAPAAAAANPEHTANSITHQQVDNAGDWWQRIDQAGLQGKYPGITAKPPMLQPWRLRVLYLTIRPASCGTSPQYLTAAFTWG